MNGISRRVALAVASAAAAGALAGCGASGAGPVDATAADNRAADQRLQGRWRILDFRPETPLDPVMASLLALHQPTLVVEVAGGRIRALSSTPGIHFDRRYEVREALGENFQLVVWDDAGVPQTSYGAFQPDGTLRVRTTSPWRGDALLARL